jgi:hypothetical protein
MIVATLFHSHLHVNHSHLRLPTYTANAGSLSYDDNTYICFSDISARISEIPVKPATTDLNEICCYGR